MDDEIIKRRSFIRPQRSERIGVGLMEDKYEFHKTLWTWKMNEKGYLVVVKKNKI